MKSLLLGLLWIAVSLPTFDALLCKPELSVVSKTDTSITIKWTCTADPAHPVKGFYLRYHATSDPHNTYYMELPVHLKSFTVDKLTSGEMYSIYLEAYDNNGEKVRSETVEAKLGGSEHPVPCKPELSVDGKTDTSITIEWTCTADPAHPVKGYYIRYNIKHRQHMSVYLDLPNPNFSTYILNELTPGATYQVTVDAYDSSGAEVPSETVEVYLGEGDEPKQPCKPMVEVVDQTIDSITVKWECNADNTSPVQGFFLGYVAISDLHNTAYTDLPGFNFNGYTLDELKCGETYHIYVEAYDYNDVKVRSETVNVTLGGSEQPLYPSPDEFLEVGDTTVTLRLDRWHSPCPVETFTTTLQDELNYMQKTHKVGSLNRITLSNLEPDAQYELHVGDNRDANHVGYSFRTLCGQKIPYIVSSKEAVKIGETSVTVYLDRWNCVNWYGIEYFESDSTEVNSRITDIKPERKSVLIQQLTAGTAYDVIVTAYNNKGVASDVHHIVTLEHQENLCGDWHPYKQKCVKAVPEAGLLTKNEAQKVCEKFEENGDIPSLITISDKNENLFMQKNLGSIPGSVWLGLTSGVDGSYYWDDGSEMGYKNWIQKKVDDENPHCGRMSISGASYWFPGTPGQWAKTKCTIRNYVACQKSRPWNAAKLQKELTNTLMQMIRLKKEMKSLQSEFELAKISSP